MPGSSSGPLRAPAGQLPLRASAVGDRSRASGSLAAAAVTQRGADCPVASQCAVACAPADERMRARRWHASCSVFGDVHTRNHPMARHRYDPCSQCGERLTVPDPATGWCWACTREWDEEHVSWDFSDLPPDPDEE